MTKNEFKPYIGSMDQLARIRRSVLDDGRGHGIRMADVEADADGMARMTLSNPDSGLTMEVAWRKAELPYFTQWKMMGEQEYVMGLEPANCHPEGQTAEKENGTLKILAPDETAAFCVRISLFLMSDPVSCETGP